MINLLLVGSFLPTHVHVFIIIPCLITKVFQSPLPKSTVIGDLKGTSLMLLAIVPLINQHSTPPSCLLILLTI
jgi:hypothetical protein